jgi:NAD(P)-dependent dehydrogenase (short-subunit alcohol dehydrogenase family)
LPALTTSRSASRSPRSACHGRNGGSDRGATSLLARSSSSKTGSTIINTASINSDSPNPHLLAYATTKGAIQNFTGGLAQLLADKGIRVNAVAPGPVWTPLIPSTMPAEHVAHFGENYPIKRPAQPRELAPVYVMLASDEASYVSGTIIGVTGGKPIL